MAEIAIPIVALGAMYIISNKKEKKKNPVESFTQRSLPNTNPIVKNFPKDSRGDVLNETNVRTYRGFKNSTENYYLPENYKKALNNEQSKVGNFQSLTGNTMSAS